MNRQAVDSIKGYFYQLDKSIIEILEIKNKTSKILIEGVEDIDIVDADRLTAIQCKNHEKIAYNHSKIKEPICMMLEHYSENKNSQIRYYLYANFKEGQNKLPDDLNIEFFKNKLFTFKKNNIEVKPGALKNFYGLKSNTTLKYIYYKSYTNNTKKIIDLIF